jgi:hypothetical protein
MNSVNRVNSATVNEQCTNSSLRSWSRRIETGTGRTSDEGVEAAGEGGEGEVVHHALPPGPSHLLSSLRPAPMPSARA